MSEATEVFKNNGDISNTFEADAEEIKDAEELGMKGVWMETLFVLVLGNNISDFLEWILVFTEDLQIIYGAFPRETDITAATFPLPLWLGYVFNPLAPRTCATYAEYIQYFSLTFAAILFWGANGAYVAFTVYRGTYVVSPLHTFRFMSAFFPSVLFIPMVEMMLSAILECTYTTDAHLTFVSDETVLCLSGYHVGTYVLSIACLLFFIPVSIFLSINFVSTDPTFKRPSSRVHGRCDALFAVLKVYLLVTTRVFADKYTAGGLSVIVVSAAMLCLIDRYRPHYNTAVNSCRCASFSSVMVFAATVLILEASPHIDKNVAMVIVLVASVFTWVMAYFLSAYRYRRRCLRVQERLKEVQTLEGYVQKNYLVFNDWPSVEIACRFITDGMDNRRRAFDESKVPLVHAIFKRGVEEFPNVPLVHLSYNLYSNFMRSSSSNWLYPLSATKKLGPAFDIAFFAYMTEGLESRQAQMTLLGSNVELKVTDFAEYKKLEKAALSNHEKARQQIRIFWHVISKDNSQPETISGIVSDVLAAVKQADESYRRLLHMYPASVSINRSYGSFLIEVKNEPEVAEIYIQRAEDLERKAIANKRGIEIYGEQTKQGAFQNSDVATAENAETVDVADNANQVQFANRDGAESEFLEIPRTDVESKENLANSDTYKRQMKRKSSVVSETSRSSRSSANSNSVARRAHVMQNMSLAADRRIKRFNIGTVVVFVAGLSVIITANALIEGYLLEEDSTQTYGRVLRRRVYFSSEIFLILRRMVLAASAGDQGEFNFQRTRLATTTRNYRQLALAGYTDIPSDMPQLRQSFITPTIPQIERAYPANVTTMSNTTLFEISEQFGNKAAILLDMSFDRFAQADMAYDEELRYIFDNYQQLQDAFTTNMAEFQVEREVSHSESIVVMWSLSLVVCAIFGIGGYISDRWFRDMRQHHLTRLNLFKKIPKNIRTAIRDNLDNSADESTEPAQSPHLSTRPAHFNSLKKFRLRGLVFVVSVFAIACSFAINGNAALTDIYELAEVITPLGELRSSAVAIELFVTELMVQDIPTTWANSSVIFNLFETAFDYYKEMMNEVVYPSEHSVGLAGFPPLMFSLWSEPSCLPVNVTVCQYPTYNYDIGFTPAVVNNGLGTLVAEYRTAASAVTATAKENGGVLDANDEQGLFIRAANRDHVTDGLAKLTEMGVGTLHDAVKINAMVTYLLLAIQLAISLLGYIFVFRAMSRWYRERDDATNQLFVILPAAATKSNEELENFIKTGIIADNTDGNSQTSLAPKPGTERQNSIMKNASVLGSHISLMVNSFRRESRATTSATDAKDEKSNQQFEAKLKKLQFEEKAQSGNESNPTSPSPLVSNSQLARLRSSPTLSRSAELDSGE